MNNHEREKNYQLARTQIKESINTPLTHEFVKMIHDTVIGPSGKYGYRTGYTTVPVQDFTTGKINYSSPDGFTRSMETETQKLLFWISDNQETTSIEETCAKLHWGLVKTHPFEDGNGRTARLLVEYILRINGYNDSECTKLNLYLEKNKSDYYNALNDGIINYRGFENPNQKWLNFIQKALLSIKK